MTRDPGDLSLPSRRRFLANTASLAGGLVIACFVPFGKRGLFAQEGAAPAAQPMDPNAFVRIGSDNTITILIKHAEMGQGVEPHCRWSWLKNSIATGRRYAWRTRRMRRSMQQRVRIQGTADRPARSNRSTRCQAGAMARAMLVEAAAQRWKVDPSACRTENGFVISGTHKASYGELADAASRLKAPAKVTLKDPKNWSLIGKPTRRIDSLSKVTGTAGFGMDVQRPGLLTGVIARAPVFGGKVKSFDATKTLAVPGVVDVVQVPSGIAVLAKHFWAARKGRDALKIEWDLGVGTSLSTVAMRADYRERAKAPGAVAKQAGDVDAALKAADKRVDAEYELPFLAHAPMEPLNCTVEINKDGCEIWTGTQFQGVDQGVVAQILGIKPEQVKIHTQFLGGGFGRRANPHSDFIAEAVHAAKAAGKPVKIVWTREDDIHGGYYRPMWLSRFSAALGADGKPTAWSHTIVGQSIMAATPFAAFSIKDGVDSASVEGAADSPYLAGIPAHRVSLHTPESPIPVLWWRSVGHSHTGFVMESFVDELAHAAKTDPLAYHRQLLPGDSRNLRALELAAKEFGWGKPCRRVTPQDSPRMNLSAVMLRSSPRCRSRKARSACIAWSAQSTAALWSTR